MLLSLVALPALAQTTTFTFDSAEELEKAGFIHWTGGGSSTFEGGLLTVRSQGYEEWIHYQPASGSFWFEQAPNARSWAVQARLKLAPGSPKSTCGVGTGLWIHDGRRLIKLAVDAGSAGIGYPFTRMIDLDTEQFHTYRIEAQGAVVRLRIDDRLVFEEQGEHTLAGGGTAALTLGSLGCTLATSFWDELTYTIEPGPRDPAAAGIEPMRERRSQLD